MNTKTIFTICVVIATATSVFAQDFSAFEATVSDVFAGREGALIVVDCSTGTTKEFNTKISSRRLAPCSTFKIWNTLIGLENGVISAPDEPFYAWDGIKRSITAWNGDLSLREAFQASCVPAFQNLAKRIGQKRMQYWINKIGYGNLEVSAGITVFWLPAPGRKTITISPDEQAQLLYNLISGNLPFSDRSISLLKEIMKAKETGQGILYGKTGSAADSTGTYILGWYVGFVESNGKTYTFACMVEGDNVMGKDARIIIEEILQTQNLL